MSETNDLQPCGHSSRWLAARDPVAKTSDKYCLFCEINLLKAQIDRLIGADDRAKEWHERAEHFHAANATARKEVQRLKAELEESAREESTALTQTEKYSVENGRLTKELADARKAALSLYTALLYDDLSRDQIVESALERWPWLGRPEPPMAALSPPEIQGELAICSYCGGAGVCRAICSAQELPASTQQCDKCGREFRSPPREDHPEGILWCVECAAEEMK